MKIKKEKKYKEMGIAGNIIYPNMVNEDKAWDLFCEALEGHGLSFGGVSVFEDDKMDLEMEVGGSIIYPIGVTKFSALKLFIQAIEAHGLLFRGENGFEHCEIVKEKLI